METSGTCTLLREGHLKMEDVNWNRIGQAVSYYQLWGFTYMETPWRTDIKVNEITLPQGAKMFTDSSGCALVGSAEQGFLQLRTEGKLKRNVKYVSAGPCFRDDPVDELHQKQFFKVELFASLENKEIANAVMLNMLENAERFFNQLSSHGVEIVKESHGYDIQLHGIELGSYGVRFHEGIGYWAFGTGLAEPRFSYAERVGNFIDYTE